MVTYLVFWPIPAKLPLIPRLRQADKYTKRNRRLTQNPTPNLPPKPIIAFVVDERLSRERAAIVGRVIQALKRFAQIDLINGSATEDALLTKLGARTYDLVMAPWYRYLKWSKVEAFYGLTRTSGPTFAGYYCEQLLPYELGEQAEHYRAILIDFAALPVHEAALLIRSLIKDSNRTGLRPLLDPQALIYCENWYSGQGLGNRMDQVLALPEIHKTEWMARATSIRIALSALWSLVYEEGPGKSEFAQTITGSSPKAYFQVGTDRNLLALRLCYTMSSWSPKDVLSRFWPNQKSPTAAAQLLLRFCDFTRAHFISETNDVEIVAGFFASAPAEKAPNETHTLWVEPIAPNLISEVPYEVPGPTYPYLRHLGGAPKKPNTDALARQVASEVDEDEESLPIGDPHNPRDRFLIQAAKKIRDLKAMVHEREQTIRELRSGGVGTSRPLPPPDAEALLEAFQGKYFEARYQIRQFELKIVEMEKKGASAAEVEALKRKMAELAAREREWIKSLATTLEAFRESRKA